MMKNNFYLLMVLFSLLSSCATQLTPAANIYTLSSQELNASSLNTAAPTTPSDAEKNTQLAILKLSAINASPLYNTSDIIYTDTPYSRNRYAYSRWSDAPPALLLSLFQSTLASSHHFRAVIPPMSAASADLQLESTLFDFSHHLNADKSSTGVISIRFYLVDNVSRQVIQTKRFTATAPASANNAEGAVSALNAAATKINHDLVQWLEKSRYQKKKHSTI